MSRPQRTSAKKARDLLTKLCEDSDEDTPRVKAKRSKGQPRKLNTEDPSTLAKIDDMPTEILSLIEKRIRDDLATSTRSLLALTEAYPNLERYFDKGIGGWWHHYCQDRYKTRVENRCPRAYAQEVGLSLECAGCGTIHATTAHAILPGVRVCEVCMGMDPWSMIAATKAKQQYKLNESDLSTLRHLTRPNPHYRNGAPMRLFSVKEIKELSETKLASKGTTIDKERRKSAERAHKIAATKQAQGDARREELQIAHASLGIEFRGDNRLCQEYVDGKSAFRVDEIVERMMTMHLLYVHTRYEELRQDARDEAYAAMRRDKETYGSHEPFKHYWRERKDDAEREALAELADLEKMGTYDQCPTCPCGRKLLKSLL